VSFIGGILDYATPEAGAAANAMRRVNTTVATTAPGSRISAAAAQVQGFTVAVKGSVLLVPWCCVPSKT
jgi:hypothetical protein